MDLKTVLKEVESFCGVITLKELLEKVGLTNGLDREDQEITSFIENSLCLIEREITTHEKKKRQVTLDDFVNCLEPLIGCKKVHINDFIQSRMEDFPSTHIQKKDIISRRLSSQI
jgi:hypothetical protein